MAQKIHILPDEVVNRIAAGEVVERPASVVKELIENAIDARGTEISILIDDGGLRRIRVIDNGTGMGRTDALTAFQRYATSKIKASDDLGMIETLGFRGEALPSIASVSRVKMVTKEEQSLSGVEIRLEGGGVKEIREVGCPRGTDVLVEDLFFNTPARRKFLRTVSTEFSHIMEAVVRIAMAHRGVRFKLFHNEKRILDVPTSKNRSIRIGSLLGNEVYRVLRQVKVKIEKLEIEGYVSEPEFSRPNARGIYVYVNGRFVRDRTIHHAVMEGYRNRIAKDRYPVVVLFLQVPPWSLDVNVHPTKSEVRFGSPGLIHQGVIELFHDFESKQVEPFEAGPAPTREFSILPLAVKESTTDYNSLSQVSDPGRGPEDEGSRVELFEETLSSLRILGQLDQTYIICESPRGLLLVDQHAAHERIVFRRLKQAVDRGAPQVQRLLLPETVEFSPLEWDAVEPYLPQLARLGFDLEPFGRNTVMIRSVPSILSGKDCRQIVSDLLRDLIEEEARSGIEKDIEAVLKVTACHGAIRSGQPLSKEEMRALLEDMKEEGFFYTCPHGRPACREIDTLQLEKMFMRKS
ncbi:MAG: DNA mismatch repair endonuclease MutL [Proteobacteria bacterium]|nr:DNA mismatch repair endonuclease MutL [Pseudomonadota bacterium]NIS70812.1 DNA mismatch repair endonuclease MutL [Pseudomonadota bacterium]